MGPVKGINIKRGDLIANQTRNMTLIADRSDNSNIKRLLEVVCVYVILQREILKSDGDESFTDDIYSIPAELGTLMYRMCVINRLF